MSPRTRGQETKTMNDRRDYVITQRYHRVDPDPPAPTADDEVVRQARIDADAARAEAARVKKELEDIRKQLPSEEQRTRWAELEAHQQKLEEEKAKAAGNFDEWRRQINEKHAKDLEAERQMRENAAAQAATIEKALQDTLVGQEFAKASDLFGPLGKTVLLPEVAQSYFAGNVQVEVVTSPNGAPNRRVIVKDHHGRGQLFRKQGNNSDEIRTTACGRPQNRQERTGNSFPLRLGRLLHRRRYLYSPDSIEFYSTRFFDAMHQVIGTTIHAPVVLWLPQEINPAET